MSETKPPRFEASLTGVKEDNWTLARLRHQGRSNWPAATFPPLAKHLPSIVGSASTAWARRRVIATCWVQVWALDQ